MTLTVVLTPEQVRWAESIGSQRYAEAPGNPRFAYTAARNGERTHQIGAMGELAVASALGLEWPARVNTFRELPDVDPFWEVRWGTTKRVKVATDDKPDQLVMWVTGDPPTFEIHGCVDVAWAQANYPALDPGDKGWKAHWVELHKLTPFDETFHATCAWFNHPERGWICVYCGNEYDGLVPEPRVAGSDSGGRSEGSATGTGPDASRPLPQSRRSGKARSRTRAPAK